VIKRLLDARGDGLALDIGIGTGYATSQVFEDRPTVCLDMIQSNLEYHRDKQLEAGRPAPICTMAVATQLPYADGAFKYILCSEVLEHLEDDDAAVAEIARVLADDGRAVITVPYSGHGYASFLERFGIKTVHDYPGPEYHVRMGYDEKTLGALLARHGLEISAHDYFLRFFTRLVVDSVSLGHIVYQRVVHRRKSWTWAEAAEIETSPAFRAYTFTFPLLKAVTKGDAFLGRFRGFGFIAAVRKVQSRTEASS